MSGFVSKQQAATMFQASVRGVEAWLAAGMPSSVERKTGRNGRPRILIDPERARLWLIENGVRTLLKTEIKQATAANSKASNAPSEPKPAAAKVSTNPGLAGALDRLRCVELRSFSDYLRALNTGDVLLQRAQMKLHSEAVRRLIEGEAVADARKEIAAQLWAEIEQAMTAWSGPVKALIEQMPRSLGPRCNISDPAVAETALREWVVKELFPILGRDPKP